MGKKYAIIAITCILSGCASSLTTGSDNFECSGIPNGKHCISTEDAYADSNKNLSKSAWVHDHKNSKPDHTAPSKAEKTQQPEVIALPGNNDPKPIRTPANVMRVWIAPWEDKNGDLHMSSLVYTEIKARRWIVGEPIESKVGGRGIYPLLRSHKPTRTGNNK